MTRPINEAPLHPREGTGGSQVLKGLFLWPQRGGPSPDTSRSCPHQLLPPRAPGAQSCCLSSAEPELSPPGPTQCPAAPPPPRFRRPSVGSGPGAVARPARSAHPPEPGKRAASAYLARSQATPEQLRGPAGYLALIAQTARIREHAAGTARGEERKSQGICLVITWHKTLGVSASPVAQPTRRELGPWALERCPLHPSSSPSPA